MAPGTEAYKKKVQELGGGKETAERPQNEIKKVEGSYNSVNFFGKYEESYRRFPWDESHSNWD